MPASATDEQLIGTLVDDFVVAMERGVPREIATFLCTDEAEAFLDHVADPDEYDPVDVTEVEPATIHAIDVFGDIAVVRLNRITDEVKSLYCRREGARWTCCEHAEFDLTAAHLDGVPEVPEPVRALRHVPIGELSHDDLCVLVDHGVAPRNLVPVLFRYLDYGRLREDAYAAVAATLLAVDVGYWATDIESTVHGRFLAKDLVEDTVLAGAARDFLGRNGSGDSV